MKKAMLRKLMKMSYEILGEEETDKIVENTIDEVLDDIKPKKRSKKKKSDN